MSEVTDLISTFVGKRKDPRTFGKLILPDPPGSGGGGGGDHGRGWRPPKPIKPHRGKKPGWNPPPLPTRTPNPAKRTWKRKPPRPPRISDIILGDPYGRHIRITPEYDIQIRDDAVIRATMGNNNTATGAKAFATGADNDVSGAYSAALGGSFANVTGDYAATIVGGDAEADNSVAIGPSSKTTIEGQLTHASGAYTSTGDAQFSRLPFHGRSSNYATPQRIGTTGTNGQRLVLENGQAWAFSGRVIANNTDHTESNEYTIEGLIRRGASAAATTLVHSTVTAVHEDEASLDFTINANTTTGDLELWTTGHASKTFHWAGYIDITMVRVP